MDAAGTWMAVAIGLGTLFLGYLAYRDRRPRTRLEFVVTTNSDLLPEEMPDDLHVVHHGVQLADPSLLIVCLVNAGDNPIPPEAFETDLVITLEGVEEIASANCTAARPSDLRPDLEIDGNAVHIKPTLINAEDLIELQIFTAGQASKVDLGGRVADLTIEKRENLPNPPGSGPQGELKGLIDYLSWYLIIPGSILVIGIGVALDSDNSTAVRVITGVAGGVAALILYPTWLNSIFRRSALWRIVK